jgi:NADP-dependent 3-hydroxy acid dehydrogenase YdfG
MSSDSYSARLHNKVVLVTGASSGIGAACARSFAQSGARLIITGRRRDRLREVQDDLTTLGSDVYAIELDVRDGRQVSERLGALPPEFQAVDILVNCAGLGRGLDKLQDGVTKEWDEIIDTNVKGLLYVTRAVLPQMVARDFGHVVNIGSIAGRQAYPGGNVYCASKAAVHMLTESLKQDLLGTQIRVSTIDPGMVETEFSVVRFHGDRARAAQVYAGMTPLRADDVADAVLYCVTRPPHVNVSEIVLLATDQSSATTVHRKK